MKKLLSLTLALVMLLGLSSVAFAADLGVQVIGPEEETEPVNLDDLKLNVEAEIDGWGILVATEFGFINKLNKYGASFPFDSGNEAEYAVLHVDITNTTLKQHDFLSAYTVKFIYDDKYEYTGWAYQYDYDRSIDHVLWSENQGFSIDPLYQGHYAFGGTLPNAVVNSKKPLQMIITIDGNEIIYNIRK